MQCELCPGRGRHCIGITSSQRPKPMSPGGSPVSMSISPEEQWSGGEPSFQRVEDSNESLKVRCVWLQTRCSSAKTTALTRVCERRDSVNGEVERCGWPQWRRSHVRKGQRHRCHPQSVVNQHWICSCIDVRCARMGHYRPDWLWPAKEPRVRRL